MPQIWASLVPKNCVVFFLQKFFRQQYDLRNYPLGGLRRAEFEFAIKIAESFVESPKHNKNKTTQFVKFDIYSIVWKKNVIVGDLAFFLATSGEFRGCFGGILEVYRGKLGGIHGCVFLGTFF